MTLAILYGIANCDQVKKARAWFSQHQIAVDFHDFKKDGITHSLCKAWLKQLNWQDLLNRRGTTWRNLSETEKLAVVDAQSAIRCMMNSPSIIKRPVLVIQSKQNTELVVGFSEEKYQQLFISSSASTI